MTDETPETPETEPEKPRRRRRRLLGRDLAGGAPAPEASAAAHASETPRSESDTSSEAAATRGDSHADAVPPRETEPDAVEETPEDVEAEEAAADVMLEADAEAEGETEEEAAVIEEEGDAVAEVDEAHEADEATAVEVAEAEAEPMAEAPPAPAPRRRRRGERPVGPAPVVRAQAKYVRSSARKARLVCDHIRGKSVEDARAILAHTSRAVARDWSKLLESAVANAENNHELVGEDLYVMAVHADEGPTIRRFRPRAMGRATRIRKRTSHLTILLTPKD